MIVGSTEKDYKLRNLNVCKMAKVKAKTARSISSIELQDATDTNRRVAERGEKSVVCWTASRKHSDKSMSNHVNIKIPGRKAYPVEISADETIGSLTEKMAYNLGVDKHNWGIYAVRNARPGGYVASVKGAIQGSVRQLSTIRTKASHKMVRGEPRQFLDEKVKVREINHDRSLRFIPRTVIR